MAMSHSELVLEFQKLYRAAFGEIPLAGESEWEKTQELQQWHSFAGGLKPEELRPLFEKVAEHWGRRGRPRLAAFWVVLKEMRGEGSPEYKREANPDDITFDQYLRVKVNGESLADKNHPPGTGPGKLIEFYRSGRRPCPRQSCGFWPIKELIGPGTGMHAEAVSSGEEVAILDVEPGEGEADDDLRF